VLDELRASIGEEGREDRMVEAVEIESFVVAFEQGLQAVHGMHLDLEVVVFFLHSCLLV